jgi:CDP-diacylglycerol--glycerol-3-phosphate 3-phosphatidyltransferase
LLLPQRVNEVIGLFHAKIVISDDNLILAGANLSTEYFEHRQDRYVFFGNATSLSDYFYDLANTITKISYQLAPQHTLIPSGPDPTTNPVQFRKTAYHALDSFLSNWYARTQVLRDQLNEYSDMYLKEHEKSEDTESTLTNQSELDSDADSDMYSATSDISDNTTVETEVKTEPKDSAVLPKLSKGTDTIVIPMLQMKQFNIQEYQRLMEIIMNIVDENSDYWRNLFITSGYLNFTNEFKNMLNKINSEVDIVCAAPQANSFYKGKGFSGWIPSAYTYFEKQIHDSSSSNKDSDLRIHEFVRPGWTYHAKGLWASYKDPETGELLPNVTVLGSTNFGRRSMNRDVEAQVLMITDNKKLQKNMANEIKNLLNYTVLVNNDTFNNQERYVSPQIKFCTYIFQNML